MTPERLAEIRAYVASPTATGMMGFGAVRDLLAAYDAIADGSAVREARTRERDAVKRAGDAEERCGELQRMLANAPSVTEREQMRRDRDGWRAKAEQKWAMRREIETALGVESGDANDDAMAKGLAAIGALLERAQDAEAERDATADELAVMRDRAKRAETEVACWRATGIALRPEIAANRMPSQPGAVTKLVEPPTLAAAMSYSEGVQAERARVVSMLRARRRVVSSVAADVVLRDMADAIEGGAT